MVHESVHVSTTIDCPAADVYDYASNPVNLSTWAAGLADQDVQLVDGQWVVESPMGRVIVAFVPTNDFGILDHDVILPDGETVRNPMRVIPNGGGCGGGARAGHGCAAGPARAGQRDGARSMCQVVSSGGV
jgi:hypothetical protein